MKSKAKLDKIKKNNTAARQLPPGWIIMSRGEITVSDIRDLLGDKSIEVWNDAGVLEIPLGEKSSVDIEEFEADPRDEYACEFIAKNSIKRLFYASFRPEDYEAAEPVLKKIAEGIDGFVCGDTEDFLPRI